MIVILSFSIWLLENKMLTMKGLTVDVISSILTYRFRLMNELNLITRSSLNSLLINSKKRFSKFNTIFLNSVLSVIQFWNQVCNLNVSNVTRVRSMYQRIDDLNWFKIISVNLFFVANSIKMTYWWSVFMSSIISKFKIIKFSIIVRLFAEKMKMCFRF